MRNKCCESKYWLVWLTYFWLQMFLFQFESTESLYPLSVWSNGNFPKCICFGRWKLNIVFVSVLRYKRQEMGLAYEPILHDRSLTFSMCFLCDATLPAFWDELKLVIKVITGNIMCTLPINLMYGAEWVNSYKPFYNNFYCRVNKGMKYLARLRETPIKW